MGWSLWIELLIRSGVLLIAGGVLRRISRTQTAAFRHRLLFWVFVLLALLPILSAVFPEIRIPLWQSARADRALVSAHEISFAVMQTSTRRALNWLLLLWAGGACVALMPMLFGAISIWRIARVAKPLRTPALKAALASLGLGPQRAPSILINNRLAVPVTCGVVRPRILLPANAAAWDVARLSAVLSHELAHIRRRDVAAQMATHLIAAFWWFQPLVWVLRRALRTESELACDAEAVESGVRPSEYAAELLAVAQSLQGHPRFSSTVISMAHSGDLENRLLNILAPPAASISPRRVATLVLALSGLAIAASAVTIHSDPSPNQQGGSTMKRTILSALLSAAGLSAATVSGAIHDASGGVLPDVHVVIYNADTHAQQEAVTGADGRFSFSGTSAGQYILRLEKGGFASILREFDLKADSATDRDFTLVNEGQEQVADKLVSSNETQAKALRIGGMVAQSNLTTKVNPVYPAAAKAARTQGAVQMETTISKDGVPLELRVVSSPSDELSQSSLEAVRLWRYRPTLLNGSPVEVTTTVIVNYTLLQ